MTLNNSLDIRKFCIECEKRPATRKGKCHTCYQREWALEHYDTSVRKLTRAKWRDKNRERLLWLSTKSRARKLDMEFTISIKDIVIPKRCPVLGLELCWNRGKDRSPSVDRKDNSKGYTPDNIQVVSGRANRLKSDATAEELEKLLKYVAS